jgi:predicted regulator of Ras-like GTPase activity (Roadblock/LC7/MglB family)
MSPLRQLLESIAGLPDAAGAMVMSDEGLVIDAVLPAGVEAEAVAALATTSLRALSTLGDALRTGHPRQLVFDAPRGVAILERLDNGTILVLADDRGDVGQLLHDLRLQRPAIAELV